MPLPGLISGVESVAVCHPVAVSPINVTVARRVPADFQIEPVWSPVFPAPLSKRIAVTAPADDGVNAMPSSIAVESLADSAAESELPDVLGVWTRHTRHPHVMPTVADGDREHMRIDDDSHGRPISVHLALI
jgi:hypothetical protein